MSQAAWKRRAVLGAGLAALALTAACSHDVGRRRVPRIGYINGAGYPGLTNAFLGELRRLGWIDGDNIRIEQRLPRPNTNDAAVYSAELANMDLDLIAASALPFALLIRQANPRMPMVVGTAAGLVSNGFARSLEHPGGIVTGMDELPPGLTARRLELLKTAAPNLRRIGLLSTTPGVGGHEIQLADAEAGAARLGVNVQPYRAATRDEIAAALAAMVRDRMEGLLNFQGGLSLGNRQLIVDFAAEHRLPAIYQAVLFAEAGGLMTWAPDQNEQLRIAARSVDRILRGERPGDIPITHPDRYYLTLNRTAARRIDLDFPAALVREADRLIE